jgi:hypothetical protein
LPMPPFPPITPIMRVMAPMIIRFGHYKGFPDQSGERF